MRAPKKLFPLTQKVTSVPAPIGGLNSRDAIASMPAEDAVNLVNWIPDTYGVRCRKGYKEWAINLPGDAQAQAIMGYFDASTPFPGGAFLSDPTSMPGALFVATPTAIYDITTTTDAPVASIALSGGTNAGWFSHTMLANSGGTFLLACSEDDGYFTFDGTTWVKRIAGVGAGEINGVDPANLVQVCVWKRRAWFVERDTAQAWYLDVDSFAGTATVFDFGPLFKHGGHLSFIATWTIDAGEGIDDFLVVVGSNGDVLVYKGTDPDDPAEFGLVGSWFVGQIPIGRRAFTQYGGDLVIVSADGVFPMSYVTRGGAALLQASNKEYVSKIKPTIGEDLRASFTVRGWQCAIHPSERLLLINVPDYGSVQSKQYAMNTTQNNWTVFQGMPILCYGSHAGYTFGGTRDGKVLLVFTGFFDNVEYGESVGTSVRGIIQPAFSTFGSPAINKQFLMIRANFLSADTPSILSGISVNYAVQEPLGTPVYSVVGSSLWDVDLWDDAVWGGELRVYSEWVSVGGIGFAGAAGLVTETLADSILTSIDYMYSAGGPL